MLSEEEIADQLRENDRAFPKVEQANGSVRHSDSFETPTVSRPGSSSGEEGDQGNESAEDGEQYPPQDSASSAVFEIGNDDVGDRDETNPPMQNNNDFLFNLFDSGDRNACIYSWFCSCCAIADAKTALDGSSYWLNFFCWQCQLAPLRWMTRSAYGIGQLDSGIQDILYSMFFPCCTINQLYQTIQQRKNPSSDGGVEHNTGEFISDTDRSCDQCCEACLLQPCAQGKIMSHVVGMPYYLGCLCMNIFTVRNVLRYQYRIKPTFGGDVYDEILMPIGYCFGGLLICNPIIGMALHVAMSVQVLREIEKRPPCRSRQYLLGFQSSIPVVPLVPISATERGAGPVSSVNVGNGSTCGRSGHPRASGQGEGNPSSGENYATTTAAPENISDEDVFDISVHSVHLTPPRQVRVVAASEVKLYVDRRSPFANPS